MVNKFFGLALVASLFLTSCNLFKNTNKRSSSLKVEKSISKDCVLVNLSIDQHQVKTTEIDKGSTKITVEETESFNVPGRKSSVEIDPLELKKSAITVLDSFGNVFVVKLDTVNKKLGIGLSASPINGLKKKTTTYDGKNDKVTVTDDLKTSKDSTNLKLSNKQEQKEQSKETVKESKPNNSSFWVGIIPLLLIFGAVAFFKLR